MTETQTAAPQIHSLAPNLAERIAIDLIETGQARIYGPQSTMVKVWNAADRAARRTGMNVHTVSDRGGWLAVSLP